MWNLVKVRRYPYLLWLVLVLAGCQTFTQGDAIVGAEGDLPLTDKILPTCDLMVSDSSKRQPAAALWVVRWVLSRTLPRSYTVA